MARNVDELRDLLLEVARGVRDKRYSPEQAKVIAELGQVTINSARVELEFMRITKKTIPSGFLPNASALEHQPEGEEDHD